MNSSEVRALSLYVMGSLDFMDFLDEVNEETDLASLTCLYKLPTMPSDALNHDQELNDLMTPSVKKRIEDLRI